LSSAVQTINVGKLGFQPNAFELLNLRWLAMMRRLPSMTCSKHSHKLGNLRFTRIVLQECHERNRKELTKWAAELNMARSNHTFIAGTAARHPPLPQSSPVSDRASLSISSLLNRADHDRPQQLSILTVRTNGFVTD
jgi:hypothetical protein